MANEKNLIPNSKRTPSERRENARKAGKASGEVRRKRKALKESMNALLELPVADMRKYNKLARLGIDVEDIDNSQLVVVALFSKAATGDVAAIKELRNMIGEDDSASELGQLEGLMRGLVDEV